MKKLAIAIAALGGLTLGSSLLSQEPEEQKDPSFWMKQKLIYSQNILRGLVTENFELVQANATNMKALNRIEYFVRRRPEGYRTQLQSFQFSVEELLRHCQDDDLDGATLAFTQMTMSCVQCHTQLRKE